MKIKTAGALLALCITGVFSMHAGAATIDEQFANGANSYTVTLTEDSDISSVIQIRDGKDVTLDLNGHTLTPGDKTGFYVNNAKLTITDSASGGALNFVNAPYSYSSITGQTGNNMGYVKWIYAGNTSTLIIKDAAVNNTYTKDYGWESLIDVSDNSKLFLNNSIVASKDIGGPLRLISVNDSSISVVDSHINASENNIFTVAALNSDFVMNGNSNISNKASTYAYGIIAENDGNNVFLIEGGIIDTPANEISSSNAKIIGGTIKGSTEFTGNVHISGNTIIEGDISLTTSSSIPASTMEITGGTVNGNISTSGESSKVTISGGTFAIKPDDEYLAPGFSVETDDNGNFIVGGSTTKLATGTAVTAQGVNGTTATGFVTTVSGVESISSISWKVTSGIETKSTEVFEVGNVGGKGDVKIGLIIDGLDDSAAVAKATVNGTINE